MILQQINNEETFSTKKSIDFHSNYENLTKKKLTRQQGMSIKQIDVNLLFQTVNKIIINNRLSPIEIQVVFFDKDTKQHIIPKRTKPLVSDNEEIGNAILFNLVEILLDEIKNKNLFKKDVDINKEEIDETCQNFLNKHQIKYIIIKKSDYKITLKNNYKALHAYMQKYFRFIKQQYENEELMNNLPHNNMSLLEFIFLTKNFPDKIKQYKQDTNEYISKSILNNIKTDNIKKNSDAEEKLTKIKNLLKKNNLDIRKIIENSYSEEELEKNLSEIISDIKSNKDDIEKRMKISENKIIEDKEAEQDYYIGIYGDYKETVLNIFNNFKKHIDLNAKAERNIDISPS